MWSVPSFLHIGICLIIPILARAISPYLERLHIFNPVVLCYALGILFCNIGLLSFDTDTAKGVAAASVMLAIPYMLLSVDFKNWLRTAHRTVLSTFFCFLAVSVAAILSAPIFAGKLNETWKVAGMLVGTYTGSIPNLAAVGTALDAKTETLLLVQTSDILVGGVLLFFVLSPFVHTLHRFLPKYQSSDHAAETSASQPLNQAITRDSFLKSLAIVLAIVAVAGGFSLVVPGEHQDLVAILGATALAVLASGNHRVRSIPGTYDIGEWILLVFCAAVGTITDLSQFLVADSLIFPFTLAVVFGGVILHLLLCMAFKIDRDTYIITLTAGIYSPAFVGPVAQVLKNREIVLSGITSGLAGLAFGNFIGVGVAYLVR